MDIVSNGRVKLMMVVQDQETIKRSVKCNMLIRLFTPHVHHVTMIFQVSVPSLRLDSEEILEFEGVDEAYPDMSRVFPGAPRPTGALRIILGYAVEFQCQGLKISDHAMRS